MDDAPTSSKLLLPRRPSPQAPAPPSPTRTSLGPLNDAGLWAGLIFAAHLPLLLTHFQNLWLRPHYQFFPVVLIGVGCLFWARWPPEVRPPGRGRTAAAVLLLVLSVLLLGLTTALFSPWLAAISALVALAAVVVCRAGAGNSSRELAAPWAVLWLVVPPPFGWDEQLVLWLKAFTSRTASQLLDLGGINHLMSGNVLELPGRRFLVEEACSGIHSLLALLACTALFCVWARRPLVHAVLLLGTAVFWAIPANVARVTVIAVADVKWGLDLSTGWMHEALGFVLIAVALGLIACTDRWLSFLLAPIGIAESDALLFEDDQPDEDAPNAVVEPVFNPLSRLWNRLVQASDSRAETTAERADERADESPDPPDPYRPPFRLSWAARCTLAMLAGLAVCLGVLQSVMLAHSYASRLHVEQLLAEMDATSLPAEDRSWKQIDFDAVERGRNSDFGAHSKLWTYEAGPCAVTMSLDYPFLNWHDLTLCYQSQGWEVLERTVKLPPPGESHDPALRNWSYVEVELMKPSGEHAFVVFSSFDGAARPLNPAEATHLTAWERLTFRLGTGPVWRLLRDRGGAQYGTDLTGYQVQAFVQSGLRLSDQQRTEISTRYLDYRDRLRRSLLVDG